MKRAYGIEIVKGGDHPALNFEDNTVVSPITRISRRIPDQTIVSTGKLYLHKWARVFFSNNPKHLADATRQVEREAHIVTSDMVSRMVSRWLKSNEFDIETLLASGIEIRFFPTDLPREFSEITVRAKMFPVNPGDPF